MLWYGEAWTENAGEKRAVIAIEKKNGRYSEEVDAKDCPGRWRQMRSPGPKNRALMGTSILSIKIS